MAAGRLSISNAVTTGRRDGARGATADGAPGRAESPCISLRGAGPASHSTEGCTRRVKPQPEV